MADGWEDILDTRRDSGAIFCVLALVVFGIDLEKCFIGGQLVLRALLQVDISELKRPLRPSSGADRRTAVDSVNPSVQSVRLRAWTGRTAVHRGCPGRTGVLASVQTDDRDGRAGPTGASRYGMCLVTAGVCHLFYDIRRLQGPGVNPKTAVFMKDGRRALPSLSTLPGTLGNTE
ncbi:hypothetical protein HOY80DRAFT_1138322 [Tuber brumale]|nr:hypothetical protein HOY80DRAFT_1138322 [Tuber brumale]